jgi:hypothetical protein
VKTIRCWRSGLSCRLLMQIVVGLFLGGSAPALAMPGPSILVLNIAEDDRPQDDLRTYLADVLSGVGVLPVDPPLLTPVERACQSLRCLRSLALQQRVELLLTVRIYPQPTGVRDVAMWLYDARTDNDLINRGSCDSRNLETCLGNMAKQLVGPQVQAGSPGAAASSGQAKSEAPRVGSAGTQAGGLAKGLAAPPSPAGPKPWRRWVAIGLGSLAVGVLASAIALTALEGSPVAGVCPTPGNPRSGCFTYYRPVYGVGYAAAGALTLGAILTIALPRAKEERR